jgi:hypothetical protein
MAKSSGTKVYDRSSLGIQTTYKDCITPIPNAQHSDFGHFTHSDAIFTEKTPGRAESVFKAIQFAELEGEGKATK